MKFTHDERLDIGKRIYQGELTIEQAAAQFEINKYTARDYLRLYKAENNLPTRSSSSDLQQTIRIVKPKAGLDVDSLMQMSKEELIDELIKAKVNELRAKKGYEVKGGGANREFVPLNKKNTK